LISSISVFKENHAKDLDSTVPVKSDHILGLRTLTGIL
jgi:hypothetical protein